MVADELSASTAITLQPSTASAAASHANKKMLATRALARRESTVVFTCFAETYGIKQSILFIVIIF
jgi:hypothetical protein